MHKLHTILYIIVLIICVQCANQRPPTGGEKDEDPPLLVESEPKHQELNFQGDEIELVFNEAIKLNSPKEQIIITPRIQGDFEIKSKKDEVVIKFLEPLDDSTTYTINFREAIQDLNEGNPAENLKLAFSTGSYLDSLSINGRVNDLLKNKFLENITISLYPLNDTINPFEHPPVYFTKTNKKGYYQFDNLKQSSYTVVAVNDKNKNLFIDSKSESYGYSIDTLKLTSNIDSLHLSIQHLDVRPLTLQGSRQSGTTFDLKFNKYIIDYELINSDSLSLSSNFTDKSHTSIQVFNEGLIQDSLLTYAHTTDTLYNKYIDTLYVKFEPTNRSPKELSSSISIKPIIPKLGELNGLLTFSKPINTVSFDSAYIFLDSLNRLSLDSSHLSFNNRKDEAKLHYVLEQSFFEEQEQAATTSTETQLEEDQVAENKSVDKTELKQAPDNGQPNKSSIKPYIYFGPTSFISVEADSSTRMKTNLTFKKSSDLAILHVEVKSNTPSFVVQLISKDGTVAKEERNQSKFQFKNIQPGDYRMRVLVDINNNGRWDPGNYFEHTSPEPVYFYKNSEGNEVISFRANWEVGPYTLEF